MIRRKFGIREKTADVALLDMSKAFDRVSHAVLFHKLMKLCVPPTTLSLLMNWYSQSAAFCKVGNKFLIHICSVGWRKTRRRPVPIVVLCVCRWYNSEARELQAGLLDW